MRVNVSYTTGLSKAEQQIMKLPDRLANFGPLMKNIIAPMVNDMMHEHWESHGAAFGHPWPPWSPSRLRQRIKKGNVELGLLRDEDHLYRIIFREKKADTRLKLQVGGVRLTLNTAAKVGELHQHGRGHLPVRQVIPDPLPVSFTEAVKAVVHDWILFGYGPN